MLGKAQSRGHRLVRSRIRLDLKRVRMNLVKQRKPNVQSIRDRAQELRITLQNEVMVLTRGGADSVEILDDSVTVIIMELAVAVGGRKPRKETGKLSQKIYELIEKCRSMKV